MKKAFLSLFFLLFLRVFLYSAPLSYEPVTFILPDGTGIHLFVSGDEFFNYIHDADGLPLKKGEDGYYYYLAQEGDDFLFTNLRFGIDDPLGHPEIGKVITPSWVSEKRDAFFRMMSGLNPEEKLRNTAKSTGAVNNLVIYIRFKNETDFTVPRSTYETRFNSLVENSLRYYYHEVSYGKLDVVSYHMPETGSGVTCFTDIYERSYYRPRTESNPNGYDGDADLTSREHALLARAATWVNDNYSLPVGVNFDMDHDGEFDNVSFVIRGVPDGWSDLLWPHRWVLYSKTARIGGLKVYGYTLQLEDVSPKTLSHEMFHALGAPDLYHYDNDNVPVGPWDIMATGRGHPGAWMKYKYGGWIGTIPEITKSGRYTLKPLTEPEGNAFIIRSPYSYNQFFVVEYRKKGGLYESALPASGMIVQRIDTRYKGNAGGPPDEVYVFRKYGKPGYDGRVVEAALPGAGVSNTFTDESNPYGFLQEGTVCGLRITDITLFADSVVFSVDLDFPTDLTLTAVEDNAMDLNWNSFTSAEYVIAVSGSNEELKLTDGNEYLVGDPVGSSGRIIYTGSRKSYRHENIRSDEMYYYTVWARTGSSVSRFSIPVRAEKRSGIHTISGLPYLEGFDNVSSELPRGWKSSMNENGWSVEVGDSLTGLMTKSSFSDVNWMYTPGFDLVKGNKYLVTFSYRNQLYETSESLVLRGGPSRWDGGLNKFLLFTSSGFRFRDWVLCKAVIQPAVTGTHYFGFCTGVSGKGIVIDNFMIEKVPLETQNHSDPQEFYPNPASGKIFIPATGKTEISIYNTNGIPLFFTEIEAMKEIDLSFLRTGVYIIRFRSDKGLSSGRLVIK